MAIGQHRPFTLSGKIQPETGHSLRQPMWLASQLNLMYMKVDRWNHFRNLIPVR